MNDLIEALGRLADAIVAQGREAEPAPDEPEADTPHVVNA